MLNPLKSLFGKKGEEAAFGEGERFPLTKQMTVAVRRHANQLINADLSGYKFERRRSEYHDAKSDLVIYDQDEKKVLIGRETSSGIQLWRPD